MLGVVRAFSSTHLDPTLAITRTVTVSAAAPRWLHRCLGHPLLPTTAGGHS